MTSGLSTRAAMAHRRSTTGSKPAGWPLSFDGYGDMNLHGTGPAQGFWALLTDDERAALTGLGRTAVYPPGTVLCVEGDPATHVFVLVKGWVKIVGVTSDGHELTLALRGRGDTVGEMAGETTGHRAATVQAVGTVRALIVPYDKFSSFLDAHDGADRAYRRMVTRRWNDAESMLRTRSVTNGAQRLARLLLDLADQRDSEVILTQEELASLTGASRATVTRALSNWRQRGIIRTGQRDIIITDLAALRKIAGQQP